MALKIRRGTETERSALTGNNPAMAELFGSLMLPT